MCKFYFAPLWISVCWPGIVSADGPFYGDPPDDHHPWAVHDPNRPQPPRVEPGTFSSQDAPGQPPSDAIVLFDGTAAALGNWQSVKEEATKWVVEEGALKCVPGSGDIQSKDLFADCQLHVEWSASTEIKGSSQGRSNSGVFLMGETEVQVLDNYHNPTYADGFAGSVYGVSPPMANPLRPPGQWNVYDIVFRRPVFKDGQELDPGYLTVFANGVLVQYHTPLEGGGGHKNRSRPRPFAEKGPLRLQDHGNPMRYRNIWYRPLPPRAIEGGTDGRLSDEATMAKRESIAAEIRRDAANLTGKAKMLRLMESLCYAPHDDALATSIEMITNWLEEIQSTPADQLESKKDEVLEVNNAVQYLSKHHHIPADFPAIEPLQAIIKAQEWDKKNKSP